MDAFWIILTGSLVAINCGILGSFLILRRMSMVGDAISHAVLPGIVIAYMVSGSRASVPMLLGAALFGVLTTFLIGFFDQKLKLQKDASIGVVFTTLFAVGIILLSAFTGHVDLDQECVLYGEIAYVPLDQWFIGDDLALGPVPVWTLGATLVLILAVIGFGYKGWYITTFDPKYAHTRGIRTVWWHYGLMMLVSWTTVVSFGSVGAILVVAFLIVPANAAFLISSSLTGMLVLSTLFGISSATGGYFFAAYLNGSISGAMATVAGVILLVTALIKQRSRKRIMAGSNKKDLSGIPEKS